MINLMLTNLVKTIGLFFGEKVKPYIMALISMLSLFITGILDSKETLIGFSNSTVIIITKRGYKFINHSKVVTPPLILFFITFLILVPIIWPF